MGVINYIFRLLTFKLTREEMLNFNSRHLIAGIIGTWLVGMGRYWDDPKASLLFGLFFCHSKLRNGVIKRF